MANQIPVTEARAQFSELVNRVGYGKERIVLTRHGRRLVALVPAEDLGGHEDPGEASPVVLDLSSQPSQQSTSALTLAAQEQTDPRA